MRGPAPSVRQSNKSSVPEVKVKRKCGRPRNPIPRHKRVSHINAEHRRRGKIQNGFQTLKNMVPKYESSGRDSKADILTKAVEHCKVMKRLCKEQEKQLKELRAQQQAYNADIERHQKNLPEGQLFDDQPLTAEQRLKNLVSMRTSDNWKYFIFSYIMKPLHKSFDTMTNCATKESFVETTIKWAKQNMSQSSLRPVVSDALCNLSKETSIMARPDLMPTEALQLCQNEAKPISATVTCSQVITNHPHVGSQSHSSYPALSIHKQQPRNRFNSKRPSGASDEAGLQLAVPSVVSKKSRSPRLSPHAQSVHYEMPTSSIKTETTPSCHTNYETIQLPVKMEGVSQSRFEVVTSPSTTASTSTEMCLGSGVDSPASYDSALDLSPPGSSHESSVFGDFTGYESSLDQGYDTPSFSHSNSPLDMDFLKHKPFGSSPLEHIQSVFADLENFDSPDIVNAICESYDSPGCSLQNSFPQQPHQWQQPHYCGVDHSAPLSLDGPTFLDPVDTSYLLENVDQQFLSDPTSLLDLPTRSFLNGDCNCPFDLLLGCNYDATSMNMEESNLIAL